MINIKDAILVLADKRKAINETDWIPKANVKKSKKTERERPDGNTDLYWDIYRTDPLVGACIDYCISFVGGAGISITVIDREGNEVDVPELDEIIRKSKPRNVFPMFLKDSFVGGTGYIEKLMSTDGDQINKFGVVPAKNVVVHRDQKNVIEKYVQEVGENESDYTEYDPNEIVVFRNRAIAGEAYGRSDVEPVTEASEILRDMMIDLANFISMKAYPLVVWKLGTSDAPWGKTQVDAWASDREDVEPGDQISVQGDIDADVVGTSDQMLDIRPYLTFFASMVVSGLRVPATLTSVITDIGQFTADSQSNAYTRKINELRTCISELLEVDLFDYIIKYNGYGDDYHSKVEFLKHDDESIRMEVNNMIQTVQNSIISPEEARMELNYPQQVLGTLLKPIDKAENSAPTVDPAAYENTSENVDDDGRTGEKAQIATDST